MIAKNTYRKITFPLIWLIVTAITACQKKDIDADALAEFEDSSVLPELKYTNNGDFPFVI